MNKPIISLSLKPHLEDFCRFLFTPYKDYLILSRTKPAGKFIYSKVEISLYPHKESPFKSNNVSFILPTSRDYVDLTSKFLYISKWSEQQINDYLQALFDLEAKAFFLVGYDFKFSQKEIVDGFLEGFNLRKNAITKDAIIKNDQRKKRNFRKNVFHLIQNSRNQSIKKFISNTA